VTAPLRGGVKTRRKTTAPAFPRDPGATPASPDAETHEMMRTSPRWPVWLALSAALLLQACASLRSVDERHVAGRTYVVTGATSGFGRGTALELARLRGNVVIAGRRADVLDEVAAQVESAGGQALAVPTDVADAAQVERLAEAAIERFGHIDVWINNAGVSAIGRFDDIPLADHARIVDVNLKGAIHGSHVALRHFRQRGAGVLVNTGSVASQMPLIYQASYTATKAGILALGRTLNEELRRNGLGNIKVSTIMPWAADTPFWPHAGNYTGRVPRSILLDEPGKVVRAIVRATVYPREEYPVGWKARAADVAHHVAPDVTENLSGRILHRVQMEQASPAPATAGAIHAPMREGTGIDGGMREVMAREDDPETGQRPVPRR
jgi:short-subunit dehydrogenase